MPPEVKNDKFVVTLTDDEWKKINDGSFVDTTLVTYGGNIELIIQREDHRTEQPVDWPTSKGWWWMEDPDGEESAVWYNGESNYVCNGNDAIDRDELIGHRFVRAFIPAFPPREAD